MASKYEIEMDLRAARNQAKKIEEIANGLSRISKSEYSNILRQIKNAWKGENGQDFVIRSSGLSGRMDTTVRELKQAADTIRRMAQNTYNAEMRAWEIAHRRDYT